jgi:hypothetical protein
MPLTAKHKEFIANSVEHLFPAEGEELFDFIIGCKDSLNAAFARDPAEEIRPRSSTESRTLYQIFLCATQPETQLKGLERQHAEPVTIFEVQDYFLFYAICRLQHQLANPSADAFDITAWLATFLLPDEAEPATHSEWLARTDANTTLAEFKWDVQSTQNQLDLLQEKNRLPFVTRSPDNQGAGNYDWSLPQSSGRIFEAKIDERQERQQDDNGTVFFDLQIDLTITVKLPTNTVTFVKDNFAYYPVDDDGKQSLKQKTVWMAKNYAIKQAFLYLNRLTESKLDYDKTLIGLQLLSYQYYINAIFNNQLSLAFIYTLTKDETTTLRNESVLRILQSTHTPIDEAKALQPHTQSLLAVGLYAEKVCRGEWPLARLAAIPAEQCRTMLRPAVVNLQIIGKIPYEIAEVLSSETADVFTNDFYYESMRDDKMALSTLHPLSPAEKNNLLDEDVIALIKYGVINAEQGKHLQPANMRLIRNPFYFYLFTQKSLNAKDLLYVTDTEAAGLCEIQALEDMLQKLTKTASERLNSPTKRALLRLAALHKKLYCNLKIDPYAPGLMLLTEPHYVDQIEKHAVSLEFIKYLKKSEAATLQHPAIILLHRHGADIEFLKSLTPQEIALAEIDIYQQRLLKHETSLYNFLAISMNQQSTLLLPNIISLQRLGIMPFDMASTTTLHTGIVLSDKFYYDAVVKGTIPVLALHNLTLAEQENLLDEDIQKQLTAGIISIATAKNPSDAAKELIKSKFYAKRLLLQEFPDNFLATVTDKEANYLLKIDTARLIAYGALTPLTATTLSQTDRAKLSEGYRVYQLFLRKAISLPALQSLSQTEIKLIETHLDLYHLLAENNPATSPLVIIWAYAQRSQPEPTAIPVNTEVPVLTHSLQPIISQAAEMKVLSSAQVNHFLKVSVLDIQKKIEKDIRLNPKSAELPLYIFISLQISKAHEYSKESKDNQIWRETFDALWKRISTDEPNQTTALTLFGRRDKQRIESLHTFIASIAEALSKFDRVAEENLRQARVT